MHVITNSWNLSWRKFSPSYAANLLQLQPQEIQDFGDLDPTLLQHLDRMVLLEIPRGVLIHVIVEYSGLQIDT